MVTRIARVWINRIRLPIPARGELNREKEYLPENVVSLDGFSSPVPRQPAHVHTQAESVAYSRDSLSPFSPENLVSRDGFGSPVPRQHAHLHLRLNLVLTYGIPPEFRDASIY